MSTVPTPATPGVNRRTAPAENPFHFEDHAGFCALGELTAPGPIGDTPLEFRMLAGDVRWPVWWRVSERPVSSAADSERAVWLDLAICGEYFKVYWPPLPRVRACTLADLRHGGLCWPVAAGIVTGGAAGDPAPDAGYWLADVFYTGAAWGADR